MNHQEITKKSPRNHQEITSPILKVTHKTQFSNHHSKIKSHMKSWPFDPFDHHPLAHPQQLSAGARGHQADRGLRSSARAGPRVPHADGGLVAAGTRREIGGWWKGQRLKTLGTIFTREKFVGQKNTKRNLDVFPSEIGIVETESEVGWSSKDVGNSSKYGCTMIHQRFWSQKILLLTNQIVISPMGIEPPKVIIELGNHSETCPVYSWYHRYA